MTRALYIALASALITTAAIKAAPALAQAPGGETSISLVRTADLDLGSEAGRRQLDQRLAHAAREVCGTASDFDVEGKNAVRKCRGETLAKARARLESVVAERRAVIAVTANR
ncbi:MAG TPA: UrcA family protein [Sphingomicrobium sp.]|nr:UrcA family protein [Sphingomicrobium sp.]